MATSTLIPRRIQLLGPAWTRAFRCVWMLEELGLPYTVDDSAMPATRTVRKYVSTGKVPVLLEYDSEDAFRRETPSFALSESSAINTYLADRYTTTTSCNNNNTCLVPTPGTRERALYDETISCLTTELDSQGLWLHRKHDAMAEHFGKIPEAVTAARVQFDRINGHLASRLSPYVCGERFTAADIVYVHCLDWAKGIQWHENWPSNVKEYRRMCHARPAYQRAKAQRDRSNPHKKQLPRAKL